MQNNILNCYQIHKYDNDAVTYNATSHTFTVRNASGASACKWQGNDMPKIGTWMIALDDVVLAVNAKSENDCKSAILRASGRPFDYLHIPHLHGIHTIADIKNDFGIDVTMPSVPVYKRTKTATALYAGLLDIARALDVAPRDVALSHSGTISITVDGTTACDTKNHIIHLPASLQPLGNLWATAFAPDDPDKAYAYLQYRLALSGTQNRILSGQNHASTPISPEEIGRFDSTLETLRKSGSCGHYPKPAENPIKDQGAWNAAVNAVEKVLAGGKLSQSIIPETTMQSPSNAERTEHHGNTNGDPRHSGISRH